MSFIRSASTNVNLVIRVNSMEKIHKLEETLQLKRSASTRPATVFIGAGHLKNEREKFNYTIELVAVSREIECSQPGQLLAGCLTFSLSTYLFQFRSLLELMIIIAVIGPTFWFLYNRNSPLLLYCRLSLNLSFGVHVIVVVVMMMMMIWHKMRSAGRFCVNLYLILSQLENCSQVVSIQFGLNRVNFGWLGSLVWQTRRRRQRRLECS